MGEWSSVWSGEEGSDGRRLRLTTTVTPEGTPALSVAVGGRGRKSASAASLAALGGDGMLASSVMAYEVPCFCLGNQARRVGPKAGHGRGKAAIDMPEEANSVARNTQS